MPDGYGSHEDYVAWVAKDAEARLESIEKALRTAFAEFIQTRQVDVIVFSNVSALDLVKAIRLYPSILKPLLAVCNIAGRAIERDLQIKNIDTYNPRLTEKEASVIAGYIKLFLPPYIEVPALSNLDRVFFVDKEIRKRKGRWEQKVVDTLNRYSSLAFRKRKFEAGGEKFELDAAAPLDGPVEIGVDVKRIEARRDIHKRCDEIVNKAAKLKLTFPQVRFAAVIYYPFVDEYVNIQNRLSSENIDTVSFASESRGSIESAIRMLLNHLGVAR